MRSESHYRPDDPGALLEDRLSTRPELSLAALRLLDRERWLAQALWAGSSRVALAVVRRDRGDRGAHDYLAREHLDLVPR